MRQYIAIIVLVALTGVRASGQTDSVLTLSAFIEQVKASHPTVKQAGNVARSGALEVMRAKGAFDPKTNINIKQKNFEGTEYYAMNQYQLKLPTRIGLEAQMGAEANSGAYLNPENSTTSSGLLYAGLSLPLGQGLTIDKKRAQLRQAQFISGASEAEAGLMMNDLVLDATRAYWQWYAAWQQLRVAHEGESLAIKRFEAVRKSAAAGDLPWVDTLEAHIQVRNRQVTVETAMLDWQQASYNLSSFWWDGDTWSGQLPQDLVPQPAVESVLLDTVIRSHLELDTLNPYLQMQAYSVEILEVERRLKAEMLKPVVELKYTPLTRQPAGNPLAAWSVNNYQWGVHFNMPLFLRKERAELRQMDLKLENSELKLKQSTVQLGNEAQSLLAGIRNLDQRLDLYRNNAQSYRRLLEVELSKFGIGESSLFLINSREVNYLNTRLQIIKLELQKQEVLAQLKWVYGIL